MTPTDPAFPATHASAPVIIVGDDAQYTPNGGLADPTGLSLTISVTGGRDVAHLQLTPDALQALATLLAHAANNWTQCDECGGWTLKADAYTPDTGGPARWARTFCGGPCAEQWSERNDPAVTR